METVFTAMHLTLHLRSLSTPQFATLLQSGVLIQAKAGQSIGAFLQGLPGFTTEYITEEVQTIFLDGTATDDLETPLTGEAPVLAVSAAMPGLAGAIFRRNSLHASLRTTSGGSASASSGATVDVSLKLFNTIARDRGMQLLHQGVRLKASTLATFLSTRPSLLAHMQDINLDGRQLTGEELLAALPGCDVLTLKVED